MLIVTLTNGMVYDSEVSMTRADLVQMFIDGCFNREPAARIIELSGGLLGADITADVAKEVYLDLDASGCTPHHELEQWLEGFGHDCHYLNDGSFGIVMSHRFD